MVDRGEEHHEQGSHYLAVMKYDEAIQFDPKNADAYIGRALAHFEVGEHEMAMADLDEAIRLRPDLAKARIARGAARVNEHNFTGAINDLNEAIRLDATNALAHASRGKAFLMQGDFEKSAEDFRQAIFLDTKDPKVACDIYYHRGLLRTYQGEINGAIADYSEVIRLSPEFMPALSNRGLLHFDIGEWEAAEKDWMRALKIQPADHITIANLARLRATCPNDKYRNGQEAIELARKACEFAGWKDSKHIAALAAANAEIGNFEQAIEWQTKAIEISPPELKEWHRQHLIDLQDGKPIRHQPKVQ